MTFFPKNRSNIEQSHVLKTDETNSTKTEAHVVLCIQDVSIFFLHSEPRTHFVLRVKREIVIFRTENIYI